ncbi:hypothetical protein NF700_09655 [Sphingomonadaceae bacterium OTU29MARTA1]|nr:hypothetical protein NF700_09655 [Sphingomonadaceae bacterium OTU29MARTA1]
MRRALALLMLLGASQAVAFDRPDEVLRVYQFPADAIPRIDGDASDWDRVPASYVIRSDQFAADDGGGRRPDPASLRATIKVGWVKGMNRLYILYEAWDDHWDFASEGLDQDILEMVVDGDRSGGPLIARFHPDIAPPPGAASHPVRWPNRDGRGCLVRFPESSRAELSHLHTRP